MTKEASHSLVWIFGIVWLFALLAYRWEPDVESKIRRSKSLPDEVHAAAELLVDLNALEGVSRLDRGDSRFPAALKTLGVTAMAIESWGQVTCVRMDIRRGGSLVVFPKRWYSHFKSSGRDDTMRVISDRMFYLKRERLWGIL